MEQLLIKTEIVVTETFADGCWNVGGQDYDC